MLRLLSLAPVALLTACAGSLQDGTNKFDSAGTSTGGDEDSDGFSPSEGDCDEGNSAVNPAATETCNGLDDDCDGAVDEGVLNTWYADEDEDGFGDATSSQEACEPPAGHASTGTDCDDTNASIYPGAVEVCDGVDNDCDGEIDSGVTQTWYPDADADGHGDADNPTELCEQESGYVADGDDCDDSNNRSFPGNTEVCDELDNDCDGTVDEGVTITYYADVDDDGYGDAGTTADECSLPTGYAVNADDCDDGNDLVNPAADEVCDGIDNDCDGATDDDTATDAATWFLDGDADGYGDATSTDIDCYQPTGYVADDTDCDDGRALTNPGATEYCNGYDDDCDGTVDESDAADASTWYIDTDGDAYGNASYSEVSCSQPSGYVADGSDCNDGNANANPGATEVCDGVDNDCDGTTDEDSATDASTWYADTDGDGYGDPTTSDVECDQPGGYVADATDCDDTDTRVHPGAREWCDGKDNDCDGTIDEDDAIDAATWYADADGDGYGDGAVTDDACSAPAGYVSNDDDCDDARALTNPGATEYCNGVDDDCDGDTDEDSAADASTWYLDADSDGYGSASVSDVACTQPSGYVSDSTDCNDATALAYPGATEVCDSLDNDCDGTTDEDSAVDATTWYRDADGDKYGDAATSDVECEQPAGYVTDATDCDDTDSGVYPGAPEYCDGEDDDCDGTIDEDASLDAATWYADTDADGYGDAATSYDACAAPGGYVSNDDDCDDTRALSNPAATEYCNGYDDDCDGSVDEDGAADVSTWYADDDADGFGDSASVDIDCDQPAGYVSDSTDCDDGSADAYPGGTEVCDGLDNDCDGTVDEDGGVTDGTTYYADDDDDGFGDATDTISACETPSGYADNAYDCDDGEPTEPAVADAINGTTSGTGSLTDPYDTIQAAIDSAFSCVVVYAGTYQEQVDLDGRSLDLWGVEGADYTTIDANASACDSSNPTDCAAALTIASGSSATPTVHGFTITGGSGRYSSTTANATCADSSASHAGRTSCTVTTYEYCGGGVYVDGDDPSFYDVIIERNTLPDFEQAKVSAWTQYWLYSYGGGVCAMDANVSFEDAYIWDNYADQGGGIYAGDGTNLTFTQGYISENEATDGAGVNLDDADADVTNTILHCNDADTDGGGLYTQTGGTSDWENVVFYKNTSSNSGSARGSQVWVGTSTTVSLLNSIAQSASVAYTVYANGSATSSYDDIYNSSGTAYGSGFAAGTGDISTDPAFTSVKCDGNPTNDTFSLKSSSSAINAGNPASSYDDADGTRNDMGAYGGPEGAW